jgi:hypothetical protein
MMGIVDPYGKHPMLVMEVSCKMHAHPYSSRVYIYIHTYVCVYICIYMYTHIHVYACIHIHVFIYMHAYIHTYMRINACGGHPQDIRFTVISL